MKTLTKSLITAVAFGASALVSQAQAVKIALVDVAKAYEGHYSLPDQQEKLKTLQGKAQEGFEALLKEGQALTVKFKDLSEQAKNPVLKEDARAAAEKDAEKLIEEIKKKEDDVQNYRQQASESISQTVANFRKAVIDQITKTAGDVAKKKGYTLLIDKSALSAAQVPIFIVTDASVDITEDVIAEINKSKPAVAAVAAPAASAPAAAAPAAAPAGDSPAVSFPGVKK